MTALAKVARSHWFYIALPVLLGASLGFRVTHPWADQPRFGEAATLFDWCLFVPLLYAICYRRLAARALATRTLALACGGMWIASRIVPDHAQSLLVQWAWLRAIGGAAVLLLEGAAIVLMLRTLFGTAPDVTSLERQGVPPALARLMLAEARFWHWVWSRLRGR